MNPDPRSPTWENLVEANPSLQSWLRSAPVVGGQGLLWWPPWARGSNGLHADVAKAVGSGATRQAFCEAMSVAWWKINEAFQAAPHVNHGATFSSAADFSRASGRKASDGFTSSSRFASPAGGMK